MGTVIAVCRSERKGTAKKNITKGLFKKNYGLAGDAHAGNWHRQVSLLSYEQVQIFRARGITIEEGAFGENLLVSGIDFKLLPLGTKLKCNTVALEVTQIGKECHSGCAIYKAVGDCIMPREGIFARVLQSGEITVGDTLCVWEG